MEFQTGIKTGLVSATALMVGSQAASAQGFEGFYGGLALQLPGGAMPMSHGDTYNYEINGDIVAGGFVGYNFAGPNGLLMGLEIAYTPSMDSSDEKSGNTTSYPEAYAVASTFDAKFKVGNVLGGGSSSSMGPTLVYGFAGLSASTTDDAGEIDYGTQVGVNYGVGAEFAMTQNFSIGVELIGRTFNGYTGDDGENNRSNYALSLRGTFRF